MEKYKYINVMPFKQHQKKMSKRVRETTLEELVEKNKEFVIDSALAKSYLQSVDAQDAMSFAAKVGTSKRYHKIVEVLRENYIWLFWAKRDLQIMGPGIEKRMPWRLTETHDLQDPDYVDMDPPEWKAYYLWYRLVITAYQWSFIRFNEGKILDAYPPNTQLEVVRLNVIKMTHPNYPDQFLDFRSEFTTRMAVKVMRHDLRDRLGKTPEFTWRNLADIYPIQNLNDSRRRADGPIVAFLEERYPKMSYGHRDDVAIILHRLMHVEFVRSHGSSSLTFSGPPYSGLLDRPPRMVEETTLLVASNLCIFCNNEAACRERDVPNHTFCDKICQRNYYYYQ